MTRLHFLTTLYNPRSMIYIQSSFRECVRGRACSDVAIPVLAQSGRADGATAARGAGRRHPTSRARRVLVYPPQVTRWDGDAISFRSAVARARPAPRATKRSASIEATASTHVDRVSRTVALAESSSSRSTFRRLPDRGASLQAPLCAALAARGRLRLARSPAGVACRDRLQAAAVAVANAAPRVIVSTSPAILVPIDGAPVWKPVAGSGGLHARDQHPRADPAERFGAADVPARVRRLAHGEFARRPVDAAVPAAGRHRCGRARRSRRRAWSTCSTAARGRIRSRRSRRAFPRSTRARRRPSSSCSRASPSSRRSSARRSRGRATRRATSCATPRATSITHCSPAAGSARPRCPARGRSSPAMRCPPTSRAFRRPRSPARCCRR